MAGPDAEAKKNPLPDQLTDPGKQRNLVPGIDDGTEYLVSPEKEQGRYHLDIVFFREPFAQIAIDLSHDHPSRQLRCHLINDRRQCLAMVTPGRPEFNQQGKGYAVHDIGKILIVQRNWFRTVLGHATLPLLDQKAEFFIVP
jgi:hypothetical protein